MNRYPDLQLTAPYAATPAANRRAYRAMLAEAKRTGWPERFRSDLLKHDRNALWNLPDAQPFLWVLRECGTCLYAIGADPIDGAGHMVWHAPTFVVDAFGADKCRFYVWDGTGLRALANAEQAAELTREIALGRTVHQPRLEHALRPSNRARNGRPPWVAMPPPSFSTQPWRWSNRRRFATG
jgi:hypothetical protein